MLCSPFFNQINVKIYLFAFIRRISVIQVALYFMRLLEWAVALPLQTLTQNFQHYTTKRASCFAGGRKKNNFATQTPTIAPRTRLRSPLQKAVKTSSAAGRGAMSAHTLRSGGIASTIGYTSSWRRSDASTHTTHGPIERRHRAAGHELEGTS